MLAVWGNCILCKGESITGIFLHVLTYGFINSILLLTVSNITITVY